MSDKKKNAKSKPKASGGSGSVLKMLGRPVTLKAIECFLKAESCFESSVVIDGAMKDIKECVTLNDVFLVPLRDKILSMDGALHFILFLRTATSKPIDDSEPAFTADAKFSADDALEFLVGCYDLGVHDAVWSHVDDAIEGDEGDDDEPEKATR